MASIEEQVLSEQRRTNDLLRQLIGRGSGSLSSGLSAPSSGSSGGSGGGVVESALSNIGNLSRGFVKLTEGSLTAGSAVDTFGRMISNLGPAGKALGQLTTDLGAVILKTNDNVNEAGKTGANWNNNLGEYNRAITGARMTQDEYNRMMKEGAAALSGIGSTINRSQANFLEMDKQLQESNVANQLKKMGLSAEEVSQVALATMANRKGLDLSTAKAQKEAAEAAINLTAAMEETTRITGISRQAQVDDLAARTKDAKIQATLMEMDEDKFNQYLAMQQSLKSLGPVVQDVADEIMSGGIRTKEGADKMASLGPAGAELEKAVRLQMNASTAAQKADAELAMQRAHAAINEQMHSKQFLDTARIATGGFADATRSALSGNAELGARLAKVKEAKQETGKNISMEEAGKQQQAEVQKNMAGKNAEGHEFGPGSTAGQSINEINRAFKDATAIAATGLNELSTSIGKAIKRIDAFPGIVQPRKQEDGSAILDQLKQKVHLSLPEAYGAATNLKKTPAEMAAPVEVTRATGSPTFESFLNGNGGFKDMFEHFDPKGVPAELHGTELVATEDQMKRFVDKLIPHDLFDQVKKQATSTNINTSTSSVEPANITIPPINLPNTDLKTKISDENTPQIKSSPASVDDISKAFTAVTSSLQSVVTQLSEVATKLKNINFEPAATKISETVSKTFEKHNPAEIVKQVTSAVKPAEKPVEVKKESSIELEMKKLADNVKDTVVKSNKPEEKPLSAIEAAFKTSSDKMHALVEKMNPGLKLPEFKPTDITDVKNNKVSKLPEVGLKDARDEWTNAELKEMETGIQSSETIKKELRDSKLKFFTDKINELKGRKDEDAVHDLPIVQAQYEEYKPKAEAEAAAAKKQRDETLAKEKKEREASATVTPPVPAKVEEKPKAPDLSKLDASLLNIAKFNQAMSSGDISKIGMAQMDLSDSGKAAEKKLGPSAAAQALIKKREALENASFDYEELKAANTKPSAEAAERLEKKKQEVAKLSIAYEEDLIKIKGRLKEHGEEAVSTAVIKSKKDQQMKALHAAEAIAAEKKFMAEHGPGSDKKPEKPADTKHPDTQLEMKKLADDIKKSEVDRQKKEEVVYTGTASQPKNTNIFEDLGSSLAGMFKTSHKPAFASGNVKYEDVAQETPEENAARLRAMNSPEAIAARKADETSELNKEIYRQKHSGLYKDNPNLKENIPAPEVVKPKIEPPKHIGGLETFKEYNARMDAQVAEQRSQIKTVMSQHAPSLTAADFTPPKPPQPKVQEMPLPPPIEPVSTSAQGKEITLKDIHDVLMQLNKNMVEMVQHTDSIKDNSRKQISATKSISNNRFA